MVELEPPAQIAPAPSAWTPAQTRAQFAAIVWLRWRITVNSLARRGGAGELAGRAVTAMIFLGLLFFLVVAAGVAGFFFAAKGHLDRIAWLLWGVFLLCQLLNIQLGQPAVNFDPTQLIRFPMRESIYVEIRLFFGMLTPANLAGTLMAAAAALGIAIATPSLWLYALIALGAFAATQVLFSRMLFAWVDRWLATRRAREALTAVLLALLVGVQWANFALNPVYDHHRTSAFHLSQQHLAWASPLIRISGPALKLLPPELAASALTAASHGSSLRFALGTLGDLAYAVLFLLIFALRMLREFHGENLSEAAAGARPGRADPATMHASTAAPARRAAAADSEPADWPSTPLTPSGATAATQRRVLDIILTGLQKEILYARRNWGVLYALIMPPLMILIFANRFSSAGKSPIWLFPAAVAYILLAVYPLSYNSFGMDGTGVQVYFLAPVRLRDVVLAKNLLIALIAAIEVILIFCLISFQAGVPSPNIVLATLLWAAGTLAVNLIFGNQRSLSAPKQVDPQRMLQRQSSQLSALISLAVLAGCYGLAALFFMACLWLHALWALAPASACFAAAGAGAYELHLRSVDQSALQHREALMEELCRIG
jgi:ABC-2 type transport system permease protein